MAGILGMVFGVLYITATGYLVFRDDILAASVARQVRIQRAYEDRIAVLRSNIDSLTSRQLLNQEAFEVRLQDLVGRQAALDARQDVIADLSEIARGAGLAPTTTRAPLPRLRPNNGEETDDVITGSITPEPARAELSSAVLRRKMTALPLPAGEETEQIVAVESSLDALALDQVGFVEHMAARVSERSAKISEVLEDLGHKPSARPAGDTAIGGPFVPLDDDTDLEAFRSKADLVAEQMEQYADLRRTAIALPLAKPIATAPITSRFGTRMDPFLRRRAMHSGIDFKAPTGTPVRVTATGTVISAGRNGGYGNMVAVRHSNGVTTRYAHLSRILVKKGEYVETGTVVGRAGSTGRSTGPHLHYEVRIKGRAVNPMNYLKAGKELAEVL